MLLTKSPLLADTVRKLLARGAKANALHILNQLQPPEIAELLLRLPVYGRVAYQLLTENDLSLACETLYHLDPVRGSQLLYGLEADEIAKILHLLDAERAKALVAAMPTEVQGEILASLRRLEAREAREIFLYPEQTAGRIMSPNVASLREDATVGEAIQWLQTSNQVEMVFYLYVVDAGGTLVGVLSLRQLLRKRPDTLLRDIMSTDVIWVTTETDQEEVAHLVSSYNFLAIPVVDSRRKLVGVITVDDVIDIIHAEATEDMYRLAGLSTQERVSSNAWTSLRTRIPRLLVSLVTAFLAALVVSFFERTIDRVAVLAVFMPIVAGLGGDAASQTLTVIVRGIALGELRWSNSRRAIFKEILIGVVNGVTMGTIVALAALLWKGLPWLGVVVAVALIGNLIVAAAVGTFVPLILMRFKVDPALASSVFVTTLTDVFGFLFLLGLGTLVLSHLT